MADDTPPTPIDSDMAYWDGRMDDIASGLNRRAARLNLGKLRMMSADVPTGNKAVVKSTIANNGTVQQRKLTVSSFASLAPSL
jgi:hypothetical protein